MFFDITTKSKMKWNFLFSNKQIGSENAFFGDGIMPSDDDKVKVLDEKFLELDQLKNMIIGEMMKMNEGIINATKALGGSDPKALQSALSSLKSFLQSSSSMMASLNTSVKEILSEVTKAKTLMEQVGMIAQQM